MKQILQSLKTGATEVADVPCPAVQRGQILIRSSHTLVSERFDPAHGAMNWLSNDLGWGVYGANLAYGAMFSLGLIAFCRSQPHPLLALAVAVPYLVLQPTLNDVIGRVDKALAPHPPQQTVRWMRFAYPPYVRQFSLVEALVVVVAMGYSRQGVAIGLGLFALLALAERNKVKFVIFGANTG